MCISESSRCVSSLDSIFFSIDSSSPHLLTSGVERTGRLCGPMDLLLAGMYCIYHIPTSEIYRVGMHSMYIASEAGVRVEIAGSNLRVRLDMTS